MLGRWFRRNIQRVLAEETKEMRRHARSTQAGVEKLMARVEKLTARVDRVGAQLSRCEDKIDRMADRQEANAARWNAAHAKFDSDLANLRTHLSQLDTETESAKVLAGATAARHVRQLPPAASLNQAEFKVFSQFGEDGILQFLLAHVPVESEIFVEFGVQDYSEANTRFLLLNNHWRGLIMDGSESAMTSVRASPIAWRHHLDAAHAWITAENINQLIAGHGYSGDIGLLSVDVDGVDYWIWKAIDVVRPRIVVCEYNALFGPTAEVTVPYDSAFSRSDAHYSWLFFGASLGALARLGETKGYQLAGVNTAGNNAFFVRRDVAGQLPARRPDEVFQTSRFREARNEEQQLSYLNYSAAQALIGGCTVLDLQRNVQKPLAEVPGWPV
jgi:hypothetical protein